jgi:hypothetical protein
MEGERESTRITTPPIERETTEQKPPSEFDSVKNVLTNPEAFHPETMSEELRKNTEQTLEKLLELSEHPPQTPEELRGLLGEKTTQMDAKTLQAAVDRAKSMDAAARAELVKAYSGALEKIHSANQHEYVSPMFSASELQQLLKDQREDLMEMSAMAATSEGIALKAEAIKRTERQLATTLAKENNQSPEEAAEEARLRAEHDDKGTLNIEVENIVEAKPNTPSLRALKVEGETPLDTKTESRISEKIAVLVENEKFLNDVEQSMLEKHIRETTGLDADAIMQSNALREKIMLAKNPAEVWIAAKSTEEELKKKLFDPTTPDASIESLSNEFLTATRVRDMTNAENAEEQTRALMEDVRRLQMLPEELHKPEELTEWLRLDALKGTFSDLSSPDNNMVAGRSHEEMLNDNFKKRIMSVDIAKLPEPMKVQVLIKRAEFGEEAVREQEKTLLDS